MRIDCFTCAFSCVFFLELIAFIISNNNNHKSKGPKWIKCFSDENHFCGDGGGGNQIEKAASNNKAKRNASKATVKSVTDNLNTLNVNSRFIPDEAYAQYFLKNLRQLREEDALIDISFTQNEHVSI